MRRFLVLLLLACLVVRWADAACGCPHHNGWSTLVTEVLAPHSHEHAETEAVPAFGHDCFGEGKAIYSVSSRVHVGCVATPALGCDARTAIVPAVAKNGGAEKPSSTRRTLSRATLQVYRI
ncbi:MAG: hypothetical protein H0T47_05300 [Planctomycetaceae bacterium]|nr:hypothetical protein [Planctomycetaceae bacterium]